MVEIYEVMLHSKYQVLSALWFPTRIFACFPYIHICKICESKGWDIFGLSKPGRGLLDAATYQNIKALGLRRVFKFSFRKSV